MYGTKGTASSEALRGPSTAEELQRVAKIVGDAPTAADMRAYMALDSLQASARAGADEAAPYGPVALCVVHACIDDDAEFAARAFACVGRAGSPAGRCLRPARAW